MQTIVIDAFIVPDESKPAFLETSRAVQNVLKTLPGFVEGYLYEKTAGNGPYNVVATAAWRDEHAFDNAKKGVPGRLKALGIDPAEKMKALNVRLERAVYTRTPW
jgi:heme-degrading monooxygenase HmoA